MTSNVTILLIDDLPFNTFVLEQLLAAPGRAFVTANDGQEGLRLALQNNVDLIILDVQMPDMDGFEVAHVLKSNKRTKEIPIIFASAEKKEKHSMIQGFEEGAVDYLPKPLDPELTKAKVSGLLTIQLQKRELMEKNLALQAAEKHIRELNASLEEKIQQLEFSNKELESFAYSVSHDLRAPVRSMIGYAAMLIEDLGTGNEQVKKPLDRIQYNAEKMNRMIDDLLTFSRLGRKEVHTTEFDMTSLVKEVIEEIGSHQPHRAQINLAELFSVRADPSLMTHVWSNLIANAIKYSSKKESPAIQINSVCNEGQVIYNIRDNGVGFNMEYASKLFGVFQRLHRSSEFEGTGVGLATVQRIISRHGGRIWTEAKVNEGATFYFAMPGNVTENGLMATSA